MDRLGAVLERFNRKERNLLTRLALDHTLDTPLRLGAAFRTSLGGALAITVPEDAWWATDYHIDWLAGALTLYLDGDSALDLPHENLCRQAATEQRCLVRGNQEDVDMIVAFGTCLILIEAKAYGAWDNPQMESKLHRLEMLVDYSQRPNPLPEQALSFHLVLVSPAPPRKLTCQWPTGLVPGDSPPHLKLRLPPERLSVSRCLDDGTPAAVCGHWRTVTIR